MNILLVGYYGHGNFGDDVLFLASLNLVRRLWPQADIAIQTEARDPSYLSELAGLYLPIVRMEDGGAFDLAFHGGGGNFFDFTEGGTRDCLVNIATKVLGARRFASAVGRARAVLGRDVIAAKRRIAIGLGIGTYTRSARRLRYELPILASMDFLGVRDAGSVANLRDLGITAQVAETSDLAFAGGWGEVMAAPKATGSVVAVVRDWNNKNDNARQVDALRAVAALKPLRVLLFDEAADRGLLPLLEDFEVETYKAGQMQCVIETLSSASAIVTSRAHGAICGAILGIPSLLLPIEPKLASISGLLPHSTILLNWSDNIEDRLVHAFSIERKIIDAEVAGNRAKLNAAIAQLPI